MKTRIGSLLVTVALAELHEGASNFMLAVVLMLLALGHWYLQWHSASAKVAALSVSTARSALPAT